MKNIQVGIKRIFDFSVSLLLIGLLTIFPVLIVIPIVIRLTSKGGALFLQDRVGKDGRIFKIYKYRTMLIPSQRVDKNGNVLKPEDSITKVGKFLRKTSLDEIPQLFNILKGEMSFVGPRPMLPTQVDKISDDLKRRHLMRPGITGLAQVMGRNNLTWDEKFVFDLQYVDRFSLMNDIKIILKTIKVVLLREGIDYVHPLGD